MIDRARIQKAKNGWMVFDNDDATRMMEIIPYVFTDWEDLNNFLKEEMKLDEQENA